MSERKQTQAYPYLEAEFEAFKSSQAPRLQKGVEQESLASLLDEVRAKLYVPESQYGGNLTNRQCEIAGLLLQKTGFVYRCIEPRCSDRINREDCLRIIRDVISSEKSAGFLAQIEEFFGGLFGGRKSDDGKKLNSALDSLLAEFRREMSAVIAVDVESFFQELYRALEYIDSILALAAPRKETPEPAEAKPPVLDNRVLISYHRILSLLNTYSDQDAAKEKERIETLLFKAFNVETVWPDLETTTEPSEEFIVYGDSELEKSVVYSPCFKMEGNVKIQGEVATPQNK